jgi:hypothetical protein
LQELIQQARRLENILKKETESRLDEAAISVEAAISNNGSDVISVDKANIWQMYVQGSTDKKKLTRILKSFACFVGKIIISQLIVEL